MRYHYAKPLISTPMYGETYICDHPVYNKCTLFKIDIKGLAIIQQRFDPETKTTYWSDIDSWLANDIYLHAKFKEYFYKYADEACNGLYPTVTVRKIMWSLRMKPIPKEKWETVFDRQCI